MKKAYSYGMAVVVLLTVLLAGCALDGGKGPVYVIGTWVDPAFGSVVVVTGEDIKFFPSGAATESDYECTIEEAGVHEWNGGETGSGVHGYLVIRYTKAPWWNPSILGQYCILRWQNFSPSYVGGATTVDYSEGYNGGIYAATAEQGKKDFTDANGSFGMYTTGAVLQ